MLLKLSQITVHYGKSEALKEVSLEVNKGEIVVIIGSNGAGKTTVLKAIAGLVHPTNGEILFDNTRIDKLPPQKITKNGISISMEGRRLFPSMTTLENLEMGTYQRQDKVKIRSDMESVFELFPILKQRGGQKAGTLSGGEQQMLAIGRAIMANPKLLLLDEPSLGLAPVVIANLAKSIKTLNKTGLTILLVEQNAEMALTLANRGYLLEVGKVTGSGESKALRENNYIRTAYLGS